LAETASAERLSAYLGLGSNEGDRLEQLRTARKRLELEGLVVEEASSVYETAPQGEVSDQSDFLNACLRVRTELDPEELLDACKRVESALGRASGGPRHGPRPIDVDLLLMGSLEYSSERVIVPHPEVTSRRFVLEPLLELDPDLELPDGTPLLRLLPRLREQRVDLVGPL
jgi:2-amino-4-hydroxy-6-hydroxymethyldihydropteridine diphosphokinase